MDGDGNGKLAEASICITVSVHRRSAPRAWAMRNDTPPRIAKRLRPLVPLSRNRVGPLPQNRVVPFKRNQVGPVTRKPAIQRSFAFRWLSSSEDSLGKADNAKHGALAFEKRSEREQRPRYTNGQQGEQRTASKGRDIVCTERRATAAN